MPKERKPGWEYYKSEFNDEEFALHKESGWVYFEKGAKYSPEELRIIKESGVMLDDLTHKVKTIIKGDIVGYERGAGTTNKGKPVESGGGKNTANDSNISGKISENISVSQNDENGDYFIF